MITIFLDLVDEQRNENRTWRTCYFVLAFECAGLESSIKRLFLGAKLV